MPTYAGVAHVKWELPFPLRLPEAEFFCWEPEEGAATFVPSPGVGTLGWSRASTLLTVDEVFGAARHTVQTYPDHDYRIASVLKSGREVITAELTTGENGGFTEPRPYTIANVFLCLRSVEATWADQTVERAAAALNNLIGIYRFITLDPLARAINGELDTYYTLVSLARIPPEWSEGGPVETLRRLHELRFGTTIGVDRVHRIGTNSYDDLFFGGPLPREHQDLFARIIREQREVELFHLLIFNAIRRLKRFEWALAVMDAQSAFEVLVAQILGEALARRGEAPSSIEAQLAYGGRYDTLQKRLVEIDRVASSEAVSAGEQVCRFLGSPEEAAWRADLYRLRHKVVHEGLRQLTFDLAKRGVVVGLKAAHAVQGLRPGFNRQLIWSGAALDLSHIGRSAGRLSRIFET